MKTIVKTLFPVLTAVTMLSGCLNEDLGQTEAVGLEKVQFSFVADDDMTKTVYDGDYQLKWNDSDKVGIFIGGTTVNAPATLSRDDDGRAVFTASVNAYKAGDLISGYYPYSESVSTNSPAVLEIPAEQNQYEANVFNGSYNPLMIKATPAAADAEASSEAMKLKFYQLGAVAEFDVYSSNKSHVGEQVKSIVYKAEGVAGTFEMDLTEESTTIASLKTKYDQVAVTMNKFVVVSQENKERLVYLAMVPGKYNGVLVVNTNRAAYTFDAKEVDFTRASVKRFLLDLDAADRNVVATGVYNWTVTAQDIKDMQTADKTIGSPAIKWSLSGTDIHVVGDDTHAFRGTGIGSSSKKTDMTLTTEAYVGTVKAVVVNASVSDYHKAASAQLSVYVNDMEVGTKTLQTIAYADHISASVDGQPMDHVFTLASPVQNPKIQVKMKLLTAEADCGWDEGRMYLKTVQILDKDYKVEEILPEEKLAKWSTPYMTHNELGAASEGGSKLWNGVTEYEAKDNNAPFRSYSKAKVEEYGAPYVVVDLGEMTSVASIGCQTGSEAFGALVKEVEFFIADQPVISPGYSKEWSAIFTSDESSDTYKEHHAKMTVFDNDVKWISLGVAKHFGWYYQMPMYIHVPFSQIGTLPKTRYIKVVLNNYGANASSKGVITEIYVNRVASVDGNPL